MAKKPCQIVSTQLHVCTASQHATFSFLTCDLMCLQDY